MRSFPTAEFIECDEEFGMPFESYQEWGEKA